MSKYLLISLSIVFLILGIGIGYVITPEYSKEDESHSGDLGKADKNYDLRYINSMIGHHKGAMELAKSARENSQNEEIIKLANMILEDEPKAIDELYEWKKDWYDDTKEVESSEVPNLGDYDKNFDLRFLNALIAHHKEGIEMTDDALTKSSRNEILDNAFAVKDFLSNGVISLEEMRDEILNSNEAK